MTFGEQQSRVMLLTSFSVGIYCCACSLPLRGICFLSETLLEKTKFSLASEHLLEIASVLGMGTCVHSSQL